MVVLGRPRHPALQFWLGRMQFQVRPLPASVLDRLHILDSSTRPPRLVTVIGANKGDKFDAEALSLWRRSLLDHDDVFRPEFLTDLIFGGVAPGDITLADDLEPLLLRWQVRRIAYEQHLHVPDGPYYLVDNVLYSVWRVYQDHQLAFVQALWPSLDDQGGFTQVHAPGNGLRGHGIVVPSRAYGQSQRSSTISEPQLGSPAAATMATMASAPKSPSESISLKGLRVAVKDNYHIRGTRTSLGNRAYFEMSSISQVTAAAVSRLAGAGAHIVGKAHLSSFAMMEHPTQSVDYQAPFNPRGDGYLIAGGSSGGSAASVASYDWINISLCSDTTGSARIPALQCGVFGFRPSTGLIPRDGLVPAWPTFDTPGWVGRDLTLFPDIFRVLGQSPKYAHVPRRNLPYSIIYPTDFIPDGCPEQVAAMDKFLHDLALAAGCTYKKISVEDDWRQFAPVEEKDLTQYLYKVTGHGWFYSAYHCFTEFVNSYKVAYNHPPFTTEVVRWYWDLGKCVTDSQYDEIMARLDIFKTWFMEFYMNTGSETIVALHIDKAQPKYRDQYPGNTNPEIPGLRSTYLAPILGAPELALPISEISYESRITGKDEKIPLVVSLLGYPGSDLDLLQWSLDSLDKSNRPVKVFTGKSAFYKEKSELVSNQSRPYDK